MTKSKTPAPEALIALFGGPADGRLVVIKSHDESTHVEDGAAYERTDASQGDARVYRFAPD